MSGFRPVKSSKTGSQAELSTVLDTISVQLNPQRQSQQIENQRDSYHSTTSKDEEADKSQGFVANRKLIVLKG